MSAAKKPDLRWSWVKLSNSLHNGSWAEKKDFICFSWDCLISWDTWSQIYGSSGTSCVVFLQWLQDLPDAKFSDIYDIMRRLLVKNGHFAYQSTRDEKNTKIASQAILSRIGDRWRFTQSLIPQVDDSDPWRFLTKKWPSLYSLFDTTAEEGFMLMTASLIPPPCPLVKLDGPRQLGTLPRLHHCLFKDMALSILPLLYDSSS